MRNELGSFLEAVRMEKKLSLREAAALTGLGHSYIRDLELGINRKTGKKVIPSINSLKKIASAYQLDIYELLIKAGFIDSSEMDPPKNTASEHQRTKTIPVFEAILPLSSDENRIIEHVYFPFQKDEQPDFALIMKGDSMKDAGIDDGDLVFFRNSVQPEYNGQIAAVYLASNRFGLIRRIAWSSQFPRYSLLPENKNYRTIDASFHEVEILGVYNGHFKPEKTH